MTVKEIVADSTLKAAPAATYASVYLGGVDIPTLVSIATGIYMLLQIYKVVLEIIAARKKGKDNASTTKAPD